jgi:hypothetical protein
MREERYQRRQSQTPVKSAAVSLRESSQTCGRASSIDPIAVEIKKFVERGNSEQVEAPLDLEINKAAKKIFETKKKPA